MPEVLDGEIWDRILLFVIQDVQRHTGTRCGWTDSNYPNTSKNNMEVLQRSVLDHE